MEFRWVLMLLGKKLAAEASREGEDPAEIAMWQECWKDNVRRAAVGLFAEPDAIAERLATLIASIPHSSAKGS